jgi:hypothetical protein
MRQVNAEHPRAGAAVAVILQPLETLTRNIPGLTPKAGAGGAPGVFLSLWACLPACACLTV